MCWQRFLNQLLTKRKNVDTKHLDAPPGVFYSVTEKTIIRLFKTIP
jgi:hypothetical protein